MSSIVILIVASIVIGVGAITVAASYPSSATGMVGPSGPTGATGGQGLVGPTGAPASTSPTGTGVYAALNAWNMSPPPQIISATGSAPINCVQAGLPDTFGFQVSTLNIALLEPVLSSTEPQQYILLHNQPGNPNFWVSGTVSFTVSYILDSGGPSTVMFGVAHADLDVNPNIYFDPMSRMVGMFNSSIETVVTFSTSFLHRQNSGDPNIIFYPYICTDYPSGNLKPGTLRTYSSQLTLSIVRVDP